MSVAQLNPGFIVPAGKDRFDDNGRRIWGQIPLRTLVSSDDSNGAMYVFVHPKMAKGGPPKHVHHEQDEWFHIFEGEFAFRIGDREFLARAGDSIFAPRAIPHAWACVSDVPGTLLTIVTPALTFEEFLMETTTHPSVPSPGEVARAFARHGMTVLGPPLDVA